MNILFLAKYFHPHLGGVEKHVGEISKLLVSKGHQVTILTLKHDPKLPDLEIKDNIKIVRIKNTNSKIGIWKSIYKQRSLIKKADLVHIHDIFFWYLPFRFIYPQKPAYTTFHGWEGSFPISTKNIKLRKIYEKLSKGNICVGDYLKKWYQTKPNIVTYGAVKENYQTNDSVRTKNFNQIIFIGRLEKVNGIDKYLEALSKIKKQHNFQITFVGDGSYKKQAQKLGQVTGMIDNSKNYLKKPAYIFASSYLTILEAMIHRRPVFTLYHNKLKKDYLSLFPGSKYLRLSESPEMLVKQFNNAVTSPKKIDQLISRAHNFAKNQTWEKLLKQYLNLWQVN